MQEHVLTTIKIGIIGQHGVGKTSLLLRQCKQIFSQQTISRIGVDFQIKKYLVRNQTVKVLLWDTVYADRFRPILKSYCRAMHGLLICFDLSDGKSLNYIDQCLSMVMEVNYSGPIALVGCKSDLEAAITAEQINQFATLLNAKYYETSAKDNIGVSEVFQKIVEAVPIKQTKVEDAATVIKRIRKQRGTKVTTCL